MDGSLKRPGRFTCPVCAETFATDVWAIVDALARPDLIAHILDGSIHRTACPNGHDFPADAPLLIYRPGAESPLIFSPATHSNSDRDKEDRESLISVLQTRLGDAWREEWTGRLRVVHRALLLLLLRDHPRGISLLALLESATWEEARVIIEGSPALPAEESLSLLACAIGDARSQGAETITPALEQARDLLKRCREIGVARAFAEITGERSVEALDIPPGLENDVRRIAELNEHSRDDVASMRLRSEDISDVLRRSPPSGYERFRAAMLNDLGVIYTELPAANSAEQAANVRRALECHREAMELYRLADDALGRATSQFNSGNAYLSMQAQTPGEQAEYLRRAVACYEAALGGFSKRETPAEFTRACVNLAGTYRRLSAFAGDGRAEYLKRTIALYEDALAFYTAEDAPQDYAGIRHLLGNLYRELPTGDREGDLRRAIEHYREAARLRTAADAPAAYALTQHNLGRAYADLLTGDRWANLRNAITCFESALTVYNPSATPREYVSTQNNLGNAFAALPTGNRVENLKRAIGCFEAALAAWSMEDAPRDYALTQHSLGNSYRALPVGDRSANLRKAIACFEEVLQVCTAEGAPLEFAAAQNNLGITYYSLATGDRNQNLLRAIDCYEKALTVYKPEGDPLNHARILGNLGNAYRDLPTGDRDANQWRAIDCYEAALQLLTPDNAPDDYAATQNNLGRAYYSLATGDREENLGKAVACCEAALLVYTPQTDPLGYTGTLDFLGTVYSELSEDDPVEHERNLRRALACYAEVLRHLHPNESPQEYAQTHHNTGTAYAALPAASTEERAENLRRALSCLQEALRFRDPASDAFGYANAQNSLGTVYSDLPAENLSERRENVVRAVQCFERALQFFTPQAEPLICRGTARNLANLYVEEGDWRAAHAAYAKAIEAAEVLYRSSFVPDSQRVEVSANAALYRGMVGSCVRLADEPRYMRDGLLYAESGKARTFLDQISQSDFPPPPWAPGNLLAREEELLAELRRIERVLASRGIPDETRRQTAGRRKALRDELEEVWDSLLQGGAHAREYVALRRAQPPSWVELSRLADRLGPDAALVEFYVLKDGIATFTLRQGWASPVCSTLPIPREQLYYRYLSVYEQEVLNRARFVKAGRRPTHSWLALGESLLLPLERTVGDAKLIYFIPHDSLHLLPLHALTVGGRPFIAGRAVAYAPSAAVLARTIERAPAEGARNALVMGYTPRAEEQSLFYGEARDVAGLFGAEAALGEFATSDHLRRHASDADIIHLSCHGGFDKNDPLASTIGLADGEFTARDWMGLRLVAGLVTLSACQTGFSEVGRGDEIVGLIRALLSAGASSALLTLWSVNADTTREWMLDFYSRMWSSADGKPQAKSLAFQQATLRLYEKYQDPYYWAPYLVVGDWR